MSIACSIFAGKTVETCTRGSACRCKGLTQRHRCDECKGNRKIWIWKTQQYIPCPACTEPEPETEHLAKAA
jgi:hypothetical protein